jgi:hypothetical protein
MSKRKYLARNELEDIVINPETFSANLLAEKENIIIHILENNLYKEDGKTYYEHLVRITEISDQDKKEKLNV